MSKKTKIIIISVSILAVIALIVVIGFVVRNMMLNESVGSTWGDTYYAYLKEVKTSEDKIKYGFEQEMNNVSVEFVQADEDKNPVMVISYQKENNEYSNIYYADAEGMSFSKSDSPSSVEYLYNIESSEYGWYEHVKSDGMHTYQSIDNLTDSLIGNTTETLEVAFDEDSFVRNEENMNVSDFDKVFVEIDISNEGKFDVDFSSDDMDFRDTITNAVNDYRPDEELTTDEIKQNVTNRVEEINKVIDEQKKQEELEKAKLTNDNIESRIGDNLKWFSAAYLGSTYGWYYVYDYKDVTGKVSIPGVDEFMMVDEVVGAQSVDNMKKSLQQYMTTDVVNKLASDLNFDYGFEEYNGKLYWVSGGVGDGDVIDYDKAKVISSDGNTSKVLLENYNSIGNTIRQRITVTVIYENDKYMITDYSVENAY